ncbi:ABC transporter permease, partial [Candidatus Woesearchaeota archaeon]|nr:ABC transporter permease [Candidatus Woesearchaeota archaeon]
MNKFLTIAVRSLLHRKVRSWLTVIGIVIGVAAIVSLISLGQGLQESINEQFENLGSNRITVAPGGIFTGPGSSGLATATLTQDDINAINRVKGVKAAAGLYLEGARVKFRGQTVNLQVAGTPLDDPDVRNEIDNIGFFQIEKGRQLKPGDRNVAVIGNSVAYEVFDKNVSLRDSIEVNGISFSVVGIQELAGTGFHDVLVRIPMDVARNLFD